MRRVHERGGMAGLGGVLVLALALTLAGCAPAKDESPPAASPSLAPVESRVSGPLGSPVTFAGTLPCADCAGIETTLTLRADGVYVLRERYLGKPPGESNPRVDWGRYEQDGAAGRLVLRGGAEAPIFYRPKDDGNLRKLGIDGAEFDAALPYDLARQAEVVAIEDPVRLVGEYRSDGGRDYFRECLTGLELPIAETGDAAALEAAANAPHPEATALMASIRGHIGVPEGAGGEEFLIVDRFERITPGTGCAPIDRGATLEMTTWRAMSIDGTPIDRGAGGAGQPELRLEPAEHRVAGSDGCNRVMGTYTLDGDALTFGPLAGTKRACPPPVMAVADAFSKALAATTRWAIESDALVLSDDTGERLRFER